MIMQHWRCHNDGCHNQNNLCYVDLWDDKHYSIARVQHEAWANAVAAGNAVVEQPPDQMYNYLKFEQGSVGQKYQKSDLKEKKNKRQSSMNSAMTEMLIFQQEQMKMTMQQQMFDLMNHFQQTQELHEQWTQQQQQISEQQHVYFHS